ncbi:MAG: T9SS type A sorting domain-containing protein [Bacteroidales bacterium]|nr:T9SS type A sorting domain-containing protein [Bacteroidales bacterium]
MYKKSFLFTLFFIIGNYFLPAQEVVTGLFKNIQISRQKPESESTKGKMHTDTLEIPFFDDFSDSNIFPDSCRWQDDFAFINNTFSIKQISAGFATFDALDNCGKLYETASSYVFEADRLTSNPINLAYNPTDSICLSFFYEPGGIADLPEEKDSLVLQFWASDEQKWHSIWKAPLTSYDKFKAVIIKIDNPIFLKKGFRFRFINYVSLSSVYSDPSIAGNCDQWNIDYILLDKNRNSADTIPADVAFTLPIRSVLKTFEQMPWKQFRKVFLSEMGEFITISYRNNDTIKRNVTRNFEITDIWQNDTEQFSAGAVNIDSCSDVRDNIALIYTFNSTGTDSALFRIKCSLITDVFDRKQNDTIIYYQLFGRDFAYDDGTAEGGYGINGLGSRNAMLAYKYKSFMPDTLRAIKICFNDSYENANQRAFDLMIWNNDNGKPGDIIYTQEEMLVQPGEDINGFYTYYLTTPLEITGEYFIGWKQRSETFLNAGIDLNTPHKGRQLYWLNGEWNVSQAAGTIMIRPVFGPPIKPTAVGTVRFNNNTIKIRPNPAMDYLYIEAGDFFPLAGSMVTIIDLQGKTVIRENYNERIDISSLPAGIYFLIINAGNKQTGVAKFIVSR